MIDLSTGADDTIVAPATAPGVAAISVIRISGGDALAIVQRLFTTRNLADQPSHTLHYGTLMHGGERIDEVVVSWFKAPRSYTGEDVIEISCHGSPFITQRIIDACLSEGARLARPGEFSRRAFLHGKMDLTQAEAVADLIAAQTDAARKTALTQLRGGFSDKLRVLREQLIQFSALIELELDFSEEDVAFANRNQLYVIVEDALQSVEKLLESFQLGNAIKQGVQVAIVGKPNAGKSTLLNTLLNEERAIVSEVAGTTRDTIEEVLNIQGILFRLVDTAGIRENTTDVIEQIGVARSLEKMQNAQVVLYLFDIRDQPAEVLSDLQRPGLADKIVVPVGNKADLAEERQLRETFIGIPDLLLISAKAHTGIDALKERLFKAVFDKDALSEDTLLTNTRHQEALKKVVSSLHDILAGMDKHLSGDLLALDIRHCLHYIGEITGQVTNKDILDYVFSKFCIGK